MARGGRPIVVAPPRRGPGIVGTMAKTAVIAGTATVTAKAVSGAMGGGQKQAAAQQQQAAAQQQAATDAQQQQQIADMQAQMNAMQSQQAQQAAAAAAPAGLTDEKLAQLQKLSDLQKSGVITEEEFAAQKAKLLNS